MTRHRRFISLLGPLIPITLAALMAVGAQASRKTDIIMLSNGDQLTGEIKALLGGKLSLSTDAMGTVKIEWEEVASLRSTYNYEMRLKSGERFFGSLDPADEPDSVQLSDVFGKHVFSSDDIVELRPLEENKLDRLDVYLSANYSFTKASSVQQAELHAEVNYDSENATTGLDSRLTASDTDEEKTTSSRIVGSRRTWTDRRNFYREVRVGYERNDELALDSRYSVGASLGRYFLDTNRKSLSGSLGLQALSELSSNGNGQESVEAVIAGDYGLWRFDSPELDFRIGGAIYPSLTESKRVRADYSARLRWEMVEDLFWDFNLWGSYDNAGAEEALGEFDWGLTTGLGWSF